MNASVIITSKKEPKELSRSLALKSVLDRINGLKNDNLKVQVSDEKLIDAINFLNSKGRLSFTYLPEFNEVDIYYIPSIKSKDILYNSPDSDVWGEKIQKRQKKIFRKTEGALFKLPYVNGDGEIAAFITDWSPFAVAPLIAVHKSHPLANKVIYDGANYFTGQYVYHPLTGDRIPVWAAHWVKPEFGTGAVIVNPAHSHADYDCALEIGFPIRFGLVREIPTSDKTTWPVPPLIKEGFSTKTGRFDGLAASAAMQVYFDTLKGAGYANKYTDLGISSTKIASLKMSLSGQVTFCKETKELAILNSSDLEKGLEKGCTIRQFELNVENILATIMISNDSNYQINIIIPQEEVETTLLFSRLLSFDLFSQEFNPNRLLLVQKIQETADSNNLPEEILSLSSLISAPLDQMAVLKKQFTEQVERFIEINKELYSKLSSSEKDFDVKIIPYSKPINDIKSAILLLDFPKAFNLIYNAQKHYKGSSSETLANDNSFIAYLLLSSTLTGITFPNIDYDIIWKAI